MRKAVIILTPDDPENKADIQTGGLSNFEMADNLNTLLKHFCRQIVDDAKDMVGNDPVELGKYIDF